jgi:hypothetical protein
VGPRAGLDTEATGKILSPLPEIELRSSGRPARSQTLYRLSYSAYLSRMTAPWKVINNVKNIMIQLLEHQQCDMIGEPANLMTFLI